MKNQLNRRNFIKQSATAGIAGCALLMAAKLNPASAFVHLADGDEKPNPKALNYCGYTCPKDCKFLQATQQNDEKLKKEAYEMWHVKERYGADFDPETAICWGCKNTEKPQGAVIKGCQVRKCAVEKGHDACIQCDTLKTCDKDLWSRFPDFHKAVIEIQVQYLKS